MKKKYLFLILAGFLLLYPLVMGIQAFLVLHENASWQEILQKILNYQLSIWISWVVLTLLAVIFKRIRKRNFFFTLTYLFVVLGFGFFAFLTDTASEYFENPRLTHGVISAIQNMAIAVVFTGFLQFSVRIFETQWHRQ